MSKNDEQIMQFIRRFNCACHRIIALGKDISTNWDITPGADYGGKIRPNRFWSLNQAPPEIHPLAIILMGTRITKYTDAGVATKLTFNLPPLLMEGLRDGFINRPTYRDIWTSDDSVPSYSAGSIGFNVGRRFLGKFKGIHLTSHLPGEYDEFFKNLP